EQLGETEKAEKIQSLMQETDAKIHEGLSLYSTMQTADLATLRSWNPNSSLAPCVKELLSCYDAGKKAVTAAQWLNAMIPGAGYFYVGQKQPAVTALLVNGLFIT